MPAPCRREAPRLYATAASKPSEAAASHIRPCLARNSSAGITFHGSIVWAAAGPSRHKALCKSHRGRYILALVPSSQPGIDR